MLLRSPLRPALRSPLYSPLVGKWGGATPAYDPDPAMIALFNGGVGVGGREGAYYRISDLSTLFEDRGGAAATTPAVVSGLVGTIKDKGPNARHQIASSDAARGTLRQSGGLYWIETDGVDDAYSSPAMSSSNPPLYLASAVRKVGSAGTSNVFSRSSNLSTYYYLNLSPTGQAILSTRSGADGVGPDNAIGGVLPIGTDGVIDGLSLIGTNFAGLNGAPYVSAANGLTTGVITGAARVNRNSSTVSVDQILFYGGYHITMQPDTTQRAMIVKALGSFAGLSL